MNEETIIYRGMRGKVHWTFKHQTHCGFNIHLFLVLQGNSVYYFTNINIIQQHKKLVSILHWNKQSSFFNCLGWIQRFLSFKFWKMKTIWPLTFDLWQRSDKISCRHNFQQRCVWARNRSISFLDSINFSYLNRFKYFSFFLFFSRNVQHCYFFHIPHSCVGKRKGYFLYFKLEVTFFPPYLLYLCESPHAPQPLQPPTPHHSVQMSIKSTAG